ncbi:MAG: hypothetical protein J0M04_03510 [Verrucomicrobia bacterium]|nr:hypothetical protein [Verrucomicrobiota bacterium]
MHGKPKQNSPGKAKPIGFALVVTLGLMVLLTLLIVGLLSLSAVGLRNGAAERARHEARANARLALILAIGELQKHLGPDQRVSAPAGILDSDPSTLQIDGVANPWWTAVWSTRWTSASSAAANSTPWVRNDTEGGLSDRRFTGTYDRKKQVLAYLVSGNEGVRTGKADDGYLDALGTRLSEKERVVLVGPGTLGNQAFDSGTDRQVVAKRVPTFRDERKSGAYAFWVGDLGVKANVGLVDRHHDSVAEPGSPNGSQRLLNAQDTASEYAGGLGRIKENEAERMCSEQSIALAKEVTKPKAQPLFHDITRESRSVLTNVRHGGLQRDLTVYLNGRSGSIPDLTVGRKRIAWGISDSDKIVGPANPQSAADQGTAWGQARYRDIAPCFALLRHWHQIGQKTGFGAPQLSMVAPAPTKDSTDLRGMNDGTNVYDGANLLPVRFLPHDEPNIAPVMVEGSIYYNLATYPDQAGSTTSQNNLRICIYPRVALWNPYNVQLAVGPTVAEFFLNGNKEVEVGYANGEKRIVSIPYGRGSTKVGAVLHGVDKSPGHYSGTVLFNLPAVTMGPGETLVFSPNQTSEYRLDNIYLNTLSCGVAPDTRRYFWQDMQRKFSQPPVRFIEMPGPGVESGADNYLIALKDASRVSGRPTDSDFDSLPLIFYANGSLQAGGSDEMPVQWSSSSPVTVYQLASGASVLPGNAVPDVRTRDGMRLRWWQETQSNILGSGQLARFPQHLQSALIGNWNPRAAYFCRTPWDNVSDQAPHMFGCYTRDLFDGDVSWSAMAPRSRKGKMLGNPFGPPSEGQDQLVLFEVPRKETGIPSLGYLRHLKLSEFGWHPSYAIGNSLADPRVGRRTTCPVFTRAQERQSNGWNQYMFGWASGRDSGRGADYWAMLHRQILFNRPDDHFVVYDLSYEANFNLWDSFFLSTGTSEDKKGFIRNPAGNPLPNGRMNLFAYGPTTEQDIVDFHRAARQILLDGGFNVHSISKEAWKAVLASTGDTGFGSDHAVPFPRLLDPPADEWLNGVADSKEATAGFRSLSDYQIDALATQIVREVKERAPFFGLADFVNRRLVNGKHGEKGPIQAAIDAAGLNTEFEKAYPLNNTRDLPNVSFDNMTDSTRLDVTLEPKSTAWGLPGYLTQGDVLQVIGSTLTARSDTFMIRGYGESVDANGKVLARAWCEGIVQRTPEPVKPDEANLNPAAVAPGGIDFGRRFRMVSFRWMNAEEI